jgi:hypothetical protein
VYEISNLLLFVKNIFYFCLVWDGIGELVVAQNLVFSNMMKVPPTCLASVFPATASGSAVSATMSKPH